MSMFNIEYIVMHKLQMHHCSISCLEYEPCVCTGDFPVHTYGPYSKCLFLDSLVIISLKIKVIFFIYFEIQTSEGKHGDIHLSGRF